ncbi:endolytic transglycosylase MltG [Fructobacillus sp. M1-13]|uniref:Aminodeoxychorismate lyase n=1 Tax=Fructobacillus papyriferae TaxID=2713171 RepID=A0ABS5QPK7_9LACO|nr:endolytic transglycosylase MltG [Fructobacillus papyriferae]MBS9335091.1 aminodeoxychorismate lyase [Fructobacillus papyriferae]MCD2159423.1 endolytic transglycosylase MltG [Fructobacillus papyriferae]
MMDTEFTKRRKTKKKHPVRNTLLALVAILLVGAGAFAYVNHEGYQAKNPNDMSLTEVQVSSSESVSQVGKKLRQKGLIRNEKYLTRYAKRYGAKPITAGTYLFSPVQSIDNVYQELAQGPSEQPVLDAAYTYIDGNKTDEQTAQGLADAANVSRAALLKAYTDKELMKEMKAKYPKLFLNAKSGLTLYDLVMPGIYKIKDQKSADDLVRFFLKRTDKEMKSYYAELKENGLPVSTAVLLAENGGKKEFDRRLAFIKKISSYAKELKSQYGILPSISIAQAIHESNWDDSELSSKYNNFYGVKSDDTTPGKSVVLQTQEVENGETVTKNARFAAYASYKDSMKAHAKTLVQGNTWNADQFKDVLAASNYKEAAQALYDDAYATDPNYPAAIIRIIQNWNLAKYDK